MTAQRDALLAARYRGVRTVEYDGRRITYATDAEMAAALGLNVGRVYIQAFAIGCFMAGLGGAVIVPAQAAILGMGVDALILSFVVIVIGGLGSLEGAFVGALIVSFVLVRPTGLFGRA